MIKKIVQKDSHRWFIWTIVFLLVSGISLTSYIMITDISLESENISTPVVSTSRK